MNIIKPVPLAITISVSAAKKFLLQNRVHLVRSISLSTKENTTSAPDDDALPATPRGRNNPRSARAGCSLSPSTDENHTWVANGLLMMMASAIVTAHTAAIKPSVITN